MAAKAGAVASSNPMASNTLLKGPAHGGIRKSAYATADRCKPGELPCPAPCERGCRSDSGDPHAHDPGNSTSDRSRRARRNGGHAPRSPCTCRSWARRARAAPRPHSATRRAHYPHRFRQVLAADNANPLPAATVSSNAWMRGPFCPRVTISARCLRAHRSREVVPRQAAGHAHQPSARPGDPDTASAARPCCRRSC